MSQPYLNGNVIVRSVLASVIIKTYLDFFNLHAQAMESHVSDRVPKKLNKLETHSSKKTVNSHAGSRDTRSSGQCSNCDIEKHPLYACPKFKSMSHDVKMSTVNLKKFVVIVLVLVKFGNNVLPSTGATSARNLTTHYCIWINRALSSTPDTVTAHIVPPQNPTLQNGT